MLSRLFPVCFRLPGSAGWGLVVRSSVCPLLFMSVLLLLSFRPFFLLDHGKDHSRTTAELSGYFDGPGWRADCFRSPFPWFVSVAALPACAFLLRRSLSVRGADRLRQWRRVTKQKSVFNPAGPSVVPFVLISVSRCPALPGVPGAFRSSADSRALYFPLSTMSNIVIPYFFHVRFLLLIIYCLILPWYNLDNSIYSLVNFLLLIINCYNLPC